MAEQGTEASAEVSAEALIAQGLQTPAKASGSPAAAGAAEKQPAGEVGTPGDGNQASGTGQYVSRGDVEKLVAERVAAELNKAQESRIQGDTRERFIREKLSDLPLSVQNLMPKTGDVKELAAAEQDIRKEMTAWFYAGLKQLGLRQPAVDGGAGTAGSIPPMALMDYSKISPEELIAQGLGRKSN